jgi:simple sugar transport system permease protein
LEHTDILALILVVLQAAVRAGTPILFVCIGEIYAERSGVLNVGLEGMMLVGAITGFFVSFTTGHAVAGLLAAAVAGALFSSIHAFVTITLRADQIVSGLTLTILGTGLSGFFGQDMIGQVGPGFEKVSVPLLERIPWIGQIFFQQDALVYLSYLIVPIAWWVMYKTHLGLAIRSVGESPETADSLGVSVAKVRYGCVMFGGAMAGLGGAYLSLAYTTMWVEQMSGGRGWITLALVIFAGWNPGRAVFGAYLFGGADALQLRLQAVGSTVPVFFLMMLPYVLTIMILVLAARKSLKRRVGAPAALGIHYAREER